jgi:hypothetical protein
MTRAGRLLATVVALAVIGGAAAAGLIWWVGGGTGPLRAPASCVAEVDGRRVELDPVQAQHAATIASVAETRGLPARAVTIALATAYQESDLYNITYGDRDSLGLFQQRPSQGWGTAEQVQDPVYSAGAFYDALVKIPDYRELEITVAAQEVQRSAFPAAYADHEADARVLASALSGNSPGAFWCTVDRAEHPVEAEAEDGLTARARTVRDQITSVFGDVDIGGYRPGGVDAGHIDGSAHYDGRALDVMFTDYADPAVTRRGWATAHWLVANAERLGIATVIYSDHIWTSRRGDDGWRSYTHPTGSTDDPTLRHLDHVHVDVVEGD